MKMEVITKEEQALLSQLRKVDWKTTLSFGQVVIQIREGEPQTVSVQKTIKLT